MDGSATHYFSGEEIRAGDRVRCAEWTGEIVFVLGTGSFADGFIEADWSYLGRGFMANYEQVGWVFTEQSDADLILVARAEQHG